MCLPYNDLISKMLEHVGFNLREDKEEQEITMIGEVALGIMHLKTVNREIFQNPPKGNKSYT